MSGLHDQFCVEEEHVCRMCGQVVEPRTHEYDVAREALMWAVVDAFSNPATKDNPMGIEAFVEFGLTWGASNAMRVAADAMDKRDALAAEDETKH